MRRVPRHTRRRKQIAACAAFGDRLDSGLPNHQTTTPSDAMPHYTGKPNVPGLGYAFLFRNYRASLGKWQTADPMGYPDGWNQLAYCGNEVATAVDLWGARQLFLGEVVVGDRQDITREKTGEPYWGVLDGEKHLFQDYSMQDQTLYAKKYRNTKLVPKTPWLNSLVEGLEDLCEATAAISGVLVALPDPVPQSKASELAAATASGAISGVSGLLGLVLSWFDDEIEVWDGEAYIGVPYKHAAFINSLVIE